MWEWKIKVSKIGIISIIVLFLSINITYFNSVFGINQTVVFLLRLAGIGLIVILYIVNRKRLSKTMCLIILLYSVFIVSTIINKGNLSNAVQILSRSIFICLYYDYFSHYESKRMKILKSWSCALGLLSIADLIVAIFFPTGLYSGGLYDGIGLLGYKTERLVYSLSWVVINAYLCSYEKNKISISVYISTIAAIIGTYLSDATGASLCLLMVMGLFMFLGMCHATSNVKLLYKIFNYKTICLVYGIIFIIVVVFQDLSFINSFVQDVLGKSATLTGRTNIWQMCVAQVIKKPVLGLGFLDSSEYVAICMGARGATNAHNFLLSLLVSGGFVAILVYVILVVSVTKVDRKRINLQGMILIIGIVGSLFIGLTSSTLAFCPFSFIFYSMLETENKKRSQKSQYHRS